MAIETMMDIVQWLLAKNIIQQQHTFVYFMCPDFSREAIVTSQNLDTLPGSHDNNRNEFNYQNLWANHIKAWAMDSRTVGTDFWYEILFGTTNQN